LDTLAPDFAPLNPGYARCRLYVDNDHVLHLENRGSPTNRQGTELILIHDAAQIAFETAEEIGILDLVSSAHSQPPEKLTYF
jgi:hypothetical protein